MRVAIVLLARMWKIHVCVFLEGKYWTTNKDLALNKATMYLVYTGKNTFYDTMRKGSLHWSVVEQPDIKCKYNLHKQKPKSPEQSKTPPAPVGRKTLNSLCAGLMDEKSKCAALRKFRKLSPKEKSSAKIHPKKADNNPKKWGKLHLQHHGIPKHQPRSRKLKCPVCAELFRPIKDLNIHIRATHKRFCYKCIHCTKKFTNYSSCYKHQKYHMNAPHVCKICRKGFWFPKNLKVHEQIHTRKGLFKCTNCSNYYTTCAAMDNHRQTHQGQVFTCDKCPYFKTDTAPNYRQHVCRKHGKGWHSPCRKRFSWPAKMFQHQKKCSTCKDIKAKVEKQAQRLADKLGKK